MHNIPVATTACLFSAQADTRLVPIGEAWARNSVNANILRHNAVVSHAGNQYVGFYDADGFVVLAKHCVVEPVEDPSYLCAKGGTGRWRED